jgi:phosphotransferase system enzyme I (PtsI)
MFPLVTGIAELREIKKILSEVKNELISEKIPFDQNLKVGIMIEVPSAVMMAPELAREADFFSLGTNDLIQFTLAVDRGNEMVADLFQDLHPALLRMIKMTIDAGKKQGIEVGMCGEMAGDPIATVILLGLGLDQFSVSPLMLPEIKKIVRSISFADAQLFAQEMLTKKTYKDIFTHSVKMMKRRFADLPIWFSKNEGR